MSDTTLVTFESAARAVMAYLRRRLGFTLWMVTRAEGDDWIVLHSDHAGHEVQEGTVFRWADTCCARMVAGLGPRVAPCIDDVPAYAAAPIRQRLAIAAYIGVPLYQADGRLFGTLCAIDPAAQPHALAGERELVETFAGVLNALLQTETLLAAEARRAERAHAEATIDPLTGLFNRRGWMRLLTSEEQRCRRYGHPASVLVLDLDDLKEVNDREGHFAGDELIARAADVLKDEARAHDVVARVGGDEFALLAVECDRVRAEVLATRLQSALEAAGVRAAIGSAQRQPGPGLEHAWHEADQRMYDAKQRAKEDRALQASS